jgi:anti-sigma B factor antagonist
VQITQTTSGPASVLTLIGDLDSFNVSYLKEQFQRLFDRGDYKVIVDLNGVDFIDSAGLGNLVSSLKVCLNNAGDLFLVGPNDSVLDLLRITRLRDVFKVCKTVEEAAAAFKE